MQVSCESSSSVSSLEPAKTYKTNLNLHPRTQYTVSEKTMLATSQNSHHSTTFLLLILPIVIVQPFSFSITNFEDSESAALVGYAGVAKIENGSILLNTLTYSGVGRAIYGQPLHLKNSSNERVTDFSTRFSFTIQSPNSLYGDGFAFYVAPLSYQIPKTDKTGYGLGLYGENIPIVAVEFDTFINDLDPPIQHVGINNGSVVSLNYTKFDIENNKGNMGHALITYNASAKLLAVSWFFDINSSSSTPNAYLSHQMDLAELLPEWVALGFSGSTGSSIEENVIHYWEFSSSLDLTISPPNEENVITTKYKGRGKVVVGAVICSIIFATVVVSITCWMIKKTRKEDEFGFDREATPRRFGYNELVAATNGFADDRRVGEGGHGEVYKGFMSDLGRVVAVKRICSDVEDSERIFRNEVKIISRLIHKNLVQLIGWCEEEGELLIVMEYLDNGSLETHLFGNRRSLKWDVRYCIALGVVRAIRYLHEDTEQCVVHRNIKPGNVLLDRDFNAKLSDFGMAKLVDPRLRSQKTRVVGTYGYLAPEGRASKESDMYGFGVLALEIACGRRSYRDEEYNHVPLMNWVWKLYVDGKILNAADEKLKSDFDVSEMRCLLTVGIWCTLKDHKERPTAEQVINVLKQKVSLPVLSTKHA
ncbi:hypothetical protein LR48_Vigan07g251100 [Vigna angularis]|uniref:non-specific serine/threonine protein kinase n=2 Tax=Phaseolus angularis TaxID=3914 RepID=A0A0L9V1Q7_PHAAN|nr:L-type lectin-domain containing receptor [Vigna angularis]KOM48807.1 hypothetical protein LR48_Vigan07g251100 [Vigna angularis]